MGVAPDSTDPAPEHPREPDAERGRRAVFRIPPTALLAALILLVCMVPFAGALPGLPVVLVIPVALGVWIVRTRTTATKHGLTVRTVFGTRELPWEALRGLEITRHSKVQAVLTDGTKVPLPSVRTRHLPVISLVSEGRVADPSGLLDDET